MHGHGILHLQTSNQSPETFQFGILLVTAAIEVDAKGIILAFLHPVTETWSTTTDILRYQSRVGLERSGFEVDSTFWAVKCQKWGIK